MANTVILLKYSSANGKPASLNTAEPAYSAVSNTLWIHDGTSIVEIGGLDYTKKINEASSQATANVLVKRDTTGNAQFNYIIANNFVGSIPTTGVTSGTYGGQTKIPVFTVSPEGRLNFAANVDVATTLSLQSDTQSGNLNLLTETLRVLGNDGISVAFSDANNTFVIDTDSTVIRTFGALQTITGDINVNGTVNVTRNVDAQNVIAYNKFYAGLATQSATPLPNLIAQFTSNSALYTQVNQQNIDGDGSADFVITADVGTDATFYTDVGMAGSSYNFYDGFDTPFEPLTGYFLVQGNTGQLGGNMIIGTTTPSTNIRFLVGGFETANVVAKLEETGLVITKGDITSNITTRVFNIANSAFDQANLAFAAANTANTFNQANIGASVIAVTNAYQANVGAGRIQDKDTWEANSGAGIINANTNLKNYADATFVKLSATSQTITSDISVSGNLTVTGTTTYINTNELNIGDNEFVLNAGLVNSVPSLNAGFTINRSLHPNTYIRWNEGADYWVIRDNIAESRIATVEGYQANVGAARIADIAAAQANTGAALIVARSYTDTANTWHQANTGASIITVTTGYQANVGAARIADRATTDANVGLGLINVTNAYQANVGQLRLDAANANTSLAANIGAARIADTASAQANTGNALIVAKSYTDTANNYLQANTGASVIAVTAAYEANIGAARIADTASAQANTGNALIVAKSYTDTANNYLQANTGAGLISNKLDSDANVGALRIDFNTANSSLAANIGAARIADQATSQANVGAGLIIVTNAYQANVGQLRLDAANANNSLAANIGAARIADQATSQANVGAGLISVTNAYQANVGQLRLDAANANTSLAANIGAARIADVAASQANVGAGLISVTNAYQANVGAARIADRATTDANVGLGLINVTNEYQANVGALRIDVNAANSSLAANIGAARIADTVAAQANVGAGLIGLNISLTDAYQANVGAARIADRATTDANVGAGLITVTNAYQANVGAARIADTAAAQANTGDARIQALGRADSAFAQANLAYNKANVGGDFSGFANVTSNVSIGTYLDLNTNQSTPSFKEGRIFYNNVSKTVSYFNETNDEIELGQKYTIRVWNNTASTISDGSAVYINGSSANGMPSVALANAATSTTSEVIGLATMNIAAGAYGYVAGAGKIDGLNTSLLSPGQELYLSSTIPGGYTTVPPAPPAVPITVGYVVSSDLTNGSILVNIHLMEGRNKTTGAILFARNDAIDEDPTHLYWDYVNNRLGINTDNPQANLHVTGDALFTGNVTISGNLAISNAQSITTSELTVGGNVIILNSQFVGTPTVNAEIIVNRGNENNVYIRWNEQINEWVMYEAGGYPEGHILHSEKTAKDWTDYTNMPAYEKLTHPIGADLANTINETAKAAFTQANTAITSGQANVGAAVIAVTAAYQANAGAGDILVTNAYQANVGQLRLDSSNANNSLAANIGAARITDAAAAQANVGAGLISVTSAYQANVGAGLIAVTNAYQANVGQLRLDTSNANTSLAANIGAARIADTAASQANVGAAVISITSAYQANAGEGDIAVTDAYRANVGAGLISVTNAYQANVGALRIDTQTANSSLAANIGAARIADTAAAQANVGAGLISVTNDYQANVGAGLISVTSAYQANVGSGLITKVAKTGDTMTGALTTNSALTGASLVANTTVTINSNAVLESTTVTTSSISQFTLDTFSFSTYRSAKYLVQMTSGSSYHMIELSLIHDGTNVYLSQYGEVKTGASLGTFDASISAGTLSLLATPTNSVTNYRVMGTLILV